jgi:hypothetical protein
MRHSPISQSHQYLGAVVAVVVVMLGVSACTTRPQVVSQASKPDGATPSPTASSPALTGQGKISADASSSDPRAIAVIADWEEMFRNTQSYEYVKANGRPDDKAWWIEQAKRFYIGRARIEYVEQINMMFMPDVPSAPGFLSEARYTAQVKSCSSTTECMVQVNLESGKYWAYDIRQKSWREANPAQPTAWMIAMQYDPASNHWKIK